eukprot:g51058.t1
MFLGGGGEVRWETERIGSSLIEMGLDYLIDEAQSIFAGKNGVYILSGIIAFKVAKAGAVMAFAKYRMNKRKAGIDAEPSSDAVGSTVLPPL